MKYVEVMQYCLSFPGSQRELVNSSGNAFALTAGSRVFGYFETGAPIQWQFSLKVTPENYEALPNPPQVRQNRVRQDKAREDKATEDSARQDDYWITIQRVENFDEKLLKELIDWSYQQAIK